MPGACQFSGVQFYTFYEKIFVCRLQLDMEMNIEILETKQNYALTTMIWTIRLNYPGDASRHVSRAQLRHVLNTRTVRSMYGMDSI